MEPGESADAFIVSGRGSLHISILIENMRREGYEFAVGPPTVRVTALPTSASSAATRLTSHHHVTPCKHTTQLSGPFLGGLLLTFPTLLVVSV